MLYKILIATVICVLSYLVYSICVALSTYSIYYNEGVVVETGICSTYLCAAKVISDNETLFIKVNSPVMVGQTVVQRCLRERCREVWVTREDYPL